MKLFSLFIFLFSLNAFAQLRTVVPKESELSDFDLKDGELVTSEDSKSLYLHSNSVVAQVGNPAGVILPFGGTSAPEGYLICDGSTVSRTTYAALFSAIGTAFGEGNGTTTFNLPDLRGRFLRGVDGSAGNDPDKTSRTAMATGGNAGNNVGSVQDDEFESHTHNFSEGQSNSGHHRAGGSSNIHNANFTTSATGGNETRPKNAYVNYIIKH